jgi:hypothetical protein
MLEAEPASLSASDHQECDVAGPERCFGAAPIILALRLVQPRSWQRGKAFGAGQRVFRVFLGKKLAQLFQIQAAQLVEVRLAMILVQAVPTGQEVLLAEQVQALAQIGGDVVHDLPPVSP